MFVTHLSNWGRRVTGSLAPLLFTMCAHAELYTAMDASGKHYFEAPPQRVVVTDWALLEQVLELGVKPVGAPELDLYRRYVQQPTLPAEITDIGLRKAPDLGKIRQLNPDVIVIGTDQKHLARPLGHISHVMYYKSFSDKYRTNGKKSRVRFLQIADMFQQRNLAEQKLADMDAEMLQIQKELQQHFDGKTPKVTLIRFAGSEKCLIYGENSIPVHALKQIGITSELVSSRTKWGEKEARISELSEIRDGVIIYINPVEQVQAVLHSEPWKSLPAVKAQRALAMRAVWSYGGAMSALYNARAVRDALLTLSSEQMIPKESRQVTSTPSGT